MTKLPLRSHEVISVRKVSLIFLALFWLSGCAVHDQAQVTLVPQGGSVSTDSQAAAAIVFPNFHLHDTSWKLLSTTDTTPQFAHVTALSTFELGFVLGSGRMVELTDGTAGAVAANFQWKLDPGTSKLTLHFTLPGAGGQPTGGWTSVYTLTRTADGMILTDDATGWTYTYALLAEPAK